MYEYDKHLRAPTAVRWIVWNTTPQWHHTTAKHSTVTYCNSTVQHMDNTVKLTTYRINSKSNSNSAVAASRTLGQAARIEWNRIQFNRIASPTAASISTSIPTAVTITVATAVSTFNTTLPLPLQCSRHYPFRWVLYLKSTPHAHTHTHTRLRDL